MKKPSPRRSRQGLFVTIVYSGVVGVIALTAGAEAAPMMGQRGNGLAVGIQAAVTAAIALPGGYYSDLLVSWVLRQLAAKNAD